MGIVPFPTSLDRVLVPTLIAACAEPKFDAGLLEDLAAMAALAPQPPAPSTGDSGATGATTAWKQMVAAHVVQPPRLIIHADELASP